MHVPVYATLQRFLASGRAPEDARPHGDAAPRDLASSPAPVEPPPGVPQYAARAFTRMGAAPFVLFLSLVLTGCRAGAAGARAESAPPTAGSALAAASRLHASVDQLARRVGRLDPEAYAIPAGLGCAAGCDVLRVKTIRFRPGEALCECGRVPPVRRWAKVPTPNRADRAQKAAELQAPVRPDGRVAMAEGATP